VRAQSEKRGVYLDDGLWDDLQKLAMESRKEKQS
jgi:LDH2 family malate/lactate/ureidoglycolate dehydrogenase